MNALAPERARPAPVSNTPLRLADWLGRFALAFGCILLAAATPSFGGLRVTGYYPGYRQSYYAPSNIDFTVLTHIIHFSIAPNTDGSLDTTINGLTPAYSTNLVTVAHAAGCKALICVGGADSQSGFEGATTPGNLAAFVGNLTNFMATYHYDGMDLDWEPLDPTNHTQFTNLVSSLRAALNRFNPHPLLTVATASQPAWFASLQSSFDQINVMTYDLSGPWGGWVTWFNSPIYDGGYRFPSTGGLVPSCNGLIGQFTSAGVAPAKLAIGIAFYGDIWEGGAGTSTGGVTQPRQGWTNAPSVTAITYFDLMSTYYHSNLYHWDTNAQAAWLGITNANASNDMFISYDDPHTCQAKVSDARNLGLGGVMIWEIGQGYLSSQPKGQRDPLLQAIKQAVLATPNFTAIARSNQDIQLDFQTQPLALYGVQRTSNLL
ncbi:MAG TPA: glycoside hydrolase family 18 protein, partial [Candidatus Acidoferrum sp.]|nr:glycoside hydrolase family 18 protein [Candidatus Acidoferrum sp.]